ncbi:MAG: GNAT family N-acetyltransferase [Jiangellaceae bacterium]
MELTWLDPCHLDSGDLDGAVALLEAARVVDCPHQLGQTVSSYAALLRHGWDGDPPFAAVARDGGGRRVVGVLELWLPRWDNTHAGSVEVTVDPAARRRGLGRQLFEAGVERTRADGRRLVLSESWDAPAGVGFAKAMGLDRASEEVKRRQDMLAVDWARLDDEYAAAENRASGYELVRMPGATPDGMLAAVVAMTEAINDAPTDDLDIEDEVFSPERIRAFETAQDAYGRRTYRLVVRERATGVLAGHTMVGVEVNRPWYGSQYDTSVLRSHRGHRLGFLLKIAMLRWLRDAEPQLRTLDTWNAASNTHMIRVNEVLGYDVVATAIDWQRHL